ncbi:EAL and HDOD domain-containing protein, partial [Senegalia sp. (in: firmicutes)]|uniref:EAL and HDOD domain-containing protein n=1 Tax=Senegalia sp. (in: firmicutes) TaxID=1924098 RepID=UPI003F95F706
MFIARQPIFNKSLKVYGYELLYRENSDSKIFDSIDSTKATASVLGGLFENGIDDIVGDKKAFINFDYDFLMSDVLELIDPNILVIEVLEEIKADEKIIDRLKYLKNKGYEIALDDFVEKYNDYPLIPLTDIIKYDILATPLNTIKNEVKVALYENKILLAEKVETKEEFLQAKEMGFKLFQGYFFSKPSVISESNNKKTIKTQYIKIISELKKDEPSYQKIAEIIEIDINLSYRLLRITKRRESKNDFESIKKALLYMGLKEIERWINILMMQDLTIKKPKELMKTSLVRSKFCEFIAENSKYKKRKFEASMMGLMSTIDALLDKPMEDAISEISLSEDIKNALVDCKGSLSYIYNLMFSYEKGDWMNVKFYAKKLHID